MDLPDKSKLNLAQFSLSLKTYISKHSRFKIDGLVSTPRLKEIIYSFAHYHEITYEHALNEILGWAAVAVSGAYKIEHPRTKEHLYCSGYFLTVADTGERKSTVQKDLHAIFKRKVAPLIEEYARDYAQYEKQLQSQKKKGKNESITMMSKPVCSDIIISDTTKEGLTMQLKEGNIPICVIRTAEGKVFFKGVGMSKENEGKIYGTLNELWSNEESSETRSKYGGKQRIPEGTCLSINIAIQEKGFLTHVATEENEDIGILGRFLMVKPNCLAEYRAVDDAPDYEDDERVYPTSVKELKERIAELLLSIIETFKVKRCIEHTLSKLSKEARVYYKAKSKEIQDSQREGKEYEGFKSFMSKGGEHLLRMIQWVDWIENTIHGSVGVDVVISAAAIFDFYAQEHVRLLSNGSKDVNKTERNKERFITYIQKKREKGIIYISNRCLLTNILKRMPKSEHNEIIIDAVERKLIEDHRYTNSPKVEIEVEEGEERIIRLVNRYVKVLPKPAELPPVIHSVDLKIDANDPGYFKGFNVNIK